MIREYVVKVTDALVPDAFQQFENEWSPEHELVRCKDCKYWYFADNRIPCERENVCGRNGIVVAPDWFCADGERRDDNG